MTAPLELTFEVACGPETAFRLWTDRIATWWPADHTVSGDPADVVIESGVGGRVYERTRGGDEHEWGRVTMWEPPVRFRYTWHLGSDPEDATEVEISFAAGAAEGTVVDVRHEGWERLGDRAANGKARNEAGWASLLPYFIGAACSDETIRGVER